MLSLDDFTVVNTARRLLLETPQYALVNGSNTRKQVRALTVKRSHPFPLDGVEEQRQEEKGRGMFGF